MLNLAACGNVIIRQPSFQFPMLTPLKCADITFTSTAPEQPSSCSNGTGISATPLGANEYVFANESASHGEGGHGSDSGSASATTTGAAAATQSAGAGKLVLGSGLVAAALVGAALSL